MEEEILDSDNDNHIINRIQFTNTWSEIGNSIMDNGLTEKSFMKIGELINYFGHTKQEWKHIYKLVIDTSENLLLNFCTDILAPKLKINHKILNGEYYYYNENINLWEIINQNTYTRHIGDLITDAQNRHIELIKKFFYDELIDKKFQINTQKDIIPFRNYILELRTLNTRNRCKEDNLTYFIDHNYSDECDQEIEKNLEEDVFKFNNNVVKDDEDFKRMVGYILTGETSAQNIFVILGKSKSNGKSRFFDILMKIFPHYVYEFTSNALDNFNKKLHKDFINIQKPIRIAFIRDKSNYNLNIDTIKSFPDGAFTSEVLYGSTTHFDHHCKILIGSNFDPKMKNESADRRFKIFNKLNKYVNDPKNSNEIQIDVNYLDKFNDSRYVNAWLNIYLPYCKMYYDEGLNLSSKTDISNYREINDFEDFKNIINKYFPNKTKITFKELSSKFYDTLRKDLSVQDFKNLFESTLGLINYDSITKEFILPNHNENQDIQIDKLQINVNEKCKYSLKSINDFLSKKYTCEEMKKLLNDFKAKNVQYIPRTTINGVNSSNVFTWNF